MNHDTIFSGQQLRVRKFVPIKMEDQQRGVPHVHNLIDLTGPSETPIKAKKIKLTKSRNSSPTILRVNKDLVTLRPLKSVMGVKSSVPKGSELTNSPTLSDVVPSPPLDTEVHDSPTPEKGGAARDITGLGDYLLLQRGTFTMLTPASKPNLKVGKIVAYNCLGEKGELVLFSDTDTGTMIADSFEKHLE